MRGRFLGRPLRQCAEILPGADLHRVAPGVSRSAFSRGNVLRTGQIPVPCQSFQLGAKVVGRTRTSQLDQLIVRRKGISFDQDSRRFRPTIQINGSQHGFESVGQKALFGAPSRRILASSQLEIPAQVQLLSRGNKVCRAYQVVLQKRELALGIAGEAMKKPFAYQATEYRIAQEFEPLVVGAGG